MVAKRRKKSSKKSVSKKQLKEEKDSKVEKALPESFWRQAFAILLIILAILLLFGSLGAGGALPVQLFEWAKSTVGLAAYIFPLILIFAAIMKIKGEDHKLSKSTFFGLIALIVSLAGFLHLFVDPIESELSAEAGEGGGLIGHVIASNLLNFLNTATGAIVLGAIIVISIHFILKLPLTSIFRLFGLGRKPKEDSENQTEEVVAKEEPKTEFTLNEGVPIFKGRRSLKNSVEKITEQDNHDALTTTSDPNWNFPSVNLLEMPKSLSGRTSRNLYLRMPSSFVTF